jgi:hypothetical protein
MSSSPDLLPARWDWPSTIGHFLLSFGYLEYSVLAYLKDNLPPKDFEKLRDSHFKDRLEKIALHFPSQKVSPENSAALKQLIAHLDPIRDLRNRIAHGYTFLKRDPATGFKILLFQVNDLDAEHHPDTQALQLDDLLKAANQLTDLIEEFRRLTGWKTATELEFNQLPPPASPPG